MNKFSRLSTKLLALLGFGYAFACGSAPEATNATEYPGIVNGNTLEENDAEIGQTEEAINIGNGGYGFSNATAQLRCAQPGVLGQNCFASAVPNNKTIGYCFQGFDNTQKGRIDLGVQQVSGQTNWTFNTTSFPCPLVFSNSPDQSGSTSGNIENFMTATPGGLVTNLTSPAGVSHVNGTWRSFTAMNVALKLAKLSIVASPAQQAEDIQHMGAHAAALFIGLGAQQDGTLQAISSPTRRAIDVGSSGFGLPSTLTPGEVCRANNISAGTPTQISALFGCGF